VGRSYLSVGIGAEKVQTKDQRLLVEKTHDRLLVALRTFLHRI